MTEKKTNTVFALVSAVKFGTIKTLVMCRGVKRGKVRESKISLTNYQTIKI